MGLTAKTIAKTHDGEWVILADPSVPAHKQLADFRKLNIGPAHDDYSYVEYQDSMSPIRKITFRSPKDQEKHQALRDSEMKVFKAEQDKDNMRESKSRRLRAYQVEAQKARELGEKVPPMPDDLKDKPTPETPDPNLPPEVKDWKPEYAQPGLPAPEFGKDGEYFGSIDTSQLLKKVAGAWVQVKLPKTNKK